MQRQASSLQQKKQAFIVAYNLQIKKNKSKDTGETTWNIVRVNEAGNQANYKYTWDNEGSGNRREPKHSWT